MARMREKMKVTEVVDHRERVIRREGGADGHDGDSTKQESMA